MGNCTRTSLMVPLPNLNCSRRNSFILCNLFIHLPDELLWELLFYLLEIDILELSQTNHDLRNRLKKNIGELFLLKRIKNLEFNEFPTVLAFNENPAEFINIKPCGHPTEDRLLSPFIIQNLWIEYNHPRNWSLIHLSTNLEESHLSFIT